MKLFDMIQSSYTFNKLAGSPKLVCGVSRDESRAAGNNFNNSGKKADEDIKAANPNSETKKNQKTETKKNTKEESAATTTETTSSEVKVDAATEAAMSSGNRVEDAHQPGVINLGFGVVMDTNKMRTPTVDPAVFAQMNANGANPQQNPYFAHMQQQAAQPMSANPMFMNGMPQQQTFVPPVQAGPIPGQGRHKVDNPPPAKKEVKKADADNVDVDLSALHGVETNPPKPPKQWPDSVSAKLPNPGPVEQAPTMPVFDNTAVTNKPNCRYLAEIEKLALECGVQIQMLQRVGVNGSESGLISCVVYTPESDKPNPYKGFTIDTGMIIDKRAKVFPAILTTGYEDVPAFPVLIPDPNNKEGGKSKNILNVQLFRDIFTGGVQMLNNATSMYTPDFMELNKSIALITMPTQNMNKETRIKVRDRLMAAMKAGVFKEVHKVDEYSRFVFKHYDKKDNSFVLSNSGVPYRFGGVPQNQKNIEIIFASDGKTRIKYVD